MKPIIRLFLLPIALLCCTKAFGQEITYSGVTYSISIGSQTAMVNHKNNQYFNNVRGSITIASSVNYQGQSYKVTSIGEKAFFGSRISSVVIPASVTSIGDKAFAFCASLQSVVYQNQNANFASNTFASCNILNKSNIKYQSSSYSTENKYASNTYTQKSSYGTSTPSSNSAKPKPNTSSANENREAASTESKFTSDIDKYIPKNTIVNDKTFAVIIANENYSDVAKVPYAINDGKSFKEYCIQTLGIPKENVKYVQDATLNNIRRNVGWIKNVMEAYQGEAKVIFYYSGHGIPDESNGNAYLLPVDGYGSDYTSGYALDDLYKDLASAPSKSITYFIDACFSGAKREGGMISSARGIALKANTGSLKGKSVIFSAASGDQTAYPFTDQQHGMFTYFLLKKLQETKGDVSYKELGQYISDNVSRKSIVTNGKKQTPNITPSSSAVNEWNNWRLK